MQIMKRHRYNGERFTTPHTIPCILPVSKALWSNIIDEASKKGMEPLCLPRRSYLVLETSETSPFSTQIFT